MGTLTERWGGGYGWSVNGQRLNVAELVKAGGPGEGMAMIPWALDHYQSTLRLSLGEAWLAKRLLKHAWQNAFTAPVFYSERLAELEAGIPRKSFYNWRKGLEGKGYLRVVARGAPTQGKYSDRRLRLDLSGLLAALALCIAIDPYSRWSLARSDGAMPEDVTQRLTHNDARFDLDLDALHRINERRDRAWGYDESDSGDGQE